MDNWLMTDQTILFRISAPTIRIHDIPTMLEILRYVRMEDIIPFLEEMDGVRTIIKTFYSYVDDLNVAVMTITLSENQLMKLRLSTSYNFLHKNSNVWTIEHACY